VVTNNVRINMNGRKKTITSAYIRGRKRLKYKPKI